MTKNSGGAEYKRALREARKENVDQKLVLRLLESSIEKGNLDATYALATWYLFGKGVKRNYYKATELLSKCTDANSSASYDLAICYEKGKGVEMNKVKAFELYSQSALQGDSQAFYEVGRCFFYGIGTMRNRIIGNLWIREAEVRGHHEDSKKTKKKN